MPSLMSSVGGGPRNPARAFFAQCGETQKKGPYKGMTFEEIHALYKRDIFLGADGYRIRNGDQVWVFETPCTPGFLAMIDYFHGCPRKNCSPVCQLDMIHPGRLREIDVSSVDMISRWESPTVKRIAVIQKKFRQLRKDKLWQGVGTQWMKYTMFARWSGIKANKKDWNEGYYSEWYWFKDHADGRWTLMKKWKKRKIHRPFWDYSLPLCLSPRAFDDERLQNRIRVPDTGYFEKYVLAGMANLNNLMNSLSADPQDLERKDAGTKRKADDGTNIYMLSIKTEVAKKGKATTCDGTNI